MTNVMPASGGTAPSGDPRLAERLVGGEVELDDVARPETGEVLVEAGDAGRLADRQRDRIAGAERALPDLLVVDEHADDVHLDGVEALRFATVGIALFEDGGHDLLGRLVGHSNSGGETTSTTSITNDRSAFGGMPPSGWPVSP